MADERIQRPIRASQPPMRGAPSAAPAGPSGSDPLAELARLIGQNDPFAEYGRDNARRAAPQQPAPKAQVAAYVDDRYAAAPARAAPHQDYAADDQPFGNSPQQYGAVPFADQPRGQVPGFPPERDADYPANAHSGVEDHEFYDDEPPRRRLGVLAIAAVFALVVVGTAGAFGYRALFGSSGASGPPPVITADSSPTKIVPAANSKDPKSGKLSYDRVSERGQDEKVVSREEQPVDRPPGADQSAGSIQGPIGSGAIGTEPKKIHTIAIRPDGTTIADATPTPPIASPSPMAAPALARASAAPAPVRPQAAEPAPSQVAARPEPPPHRVAVSAPSSGPLSLSADAPDQPAPRATRAAVAAPPTQVAPARAAPAAPSSGGSGYAVQISSQRSEGEAQAAFRSLQAQYPGQLGGKQALIRQVNLGDKGIYYRAMVGPLGSDEASQLCSNLRAAGGQCIVQRN
jgi:hypothetical protein